MSPPSRPPLLLTTIALVLVAATLKLSLWQFDRAEQKGALEQQARTALTATAVTLTQTQPVAVFERAAVIGHYLPQHEILLDNKVKQRRAGYHVVTPFALAEGGVVMVKRGFVAGDGSRTLPDIAPPPAGRVTVQGVFYNDEAGGFRLTEEVETAGVVRQQLVLAAYAKETGLPLLPLLLIKLPAADDVLAAVSLRVDYKSSQSTVYAWQWLTFCLLTLVFYIILMTRRR